MDLLTVALSNAVAATVLAVPAAVAARCCRRPALVHGLWLLVLLKLITPPVRLVPLWLPAGLDLAVSRAPQEVAGGGTAADVRRYDKPGQVDAFLPLAPQGAAPAPKHRFAERTPASPPAHRTPVVTSAGDDAAVATAEAIAAPRSGGHRPAAVSPSLAGEEVPAGIHSLSSPARNGAGGEGAALPWRSILAWSWLGGSLVWLCAAAWRVGHFRRLLRFARPAPPDLGVRARALAGRLGLRRCPGIWLVPGPVSPMLWALGGRARLLLPDALWRRLDDDQRDALLVHELAHYRRRDHWVRLVELVATGLYWWHPVLWWARHELRAAEEECCDAWVVWALPAAARAYSLALLETMTFLGEAPPVGVPAQSGVGHLHTLKRRLTMIMRGTTPRALSWTGCFAVFALGAVLLPWLPTRAASEPPDSTVRTATDDVSSRLVTRLVSSRDACTSCHQGPVVNPHPQDKLMPTHDELVRLMDEVVRNRKQVADAAARLRDAQNRLAENEKKLADAVDRFEQLNAHAGHPTKKGALPPNWAERLFTEHSHDCGVVPHYSTYQYSWRISNPYGFPVHLNGVRVTCGCLTVTPNEMTLDHGQHGALTLRVDARRFSGTKTMSVYLLFDQPARAEVRLQVKATSDISRPEPPQRVGQTERDRRVDELERKLDALRKEIEELRRKDQSRGNAPGGAPLVVPGGTPLGEYRLVPAPGTAPQNPFKDKYYAPVVPLKPGEYRLHGADLEKLKLNLYENPEKLKVNPGYENPEKLKLNPGYENPGKLKLNPYRLPQPPLPGQGGQNAGK